MGGETTLRTEYEYGQLPDCPVGREFESRLHLWKANVHGRTQHGIHGLRDYGAYSIVLCVVLVFRLVAQLNVGLFNRSADYEDDEDYGWQIIYTGEGGRNDRKDQINDQQWSNDSNSSLLASLSSNRPVRVIRKHLKNSKWGPAQGYRYEGLYRVMRMRTHLGKSGRKVCQVLLERLPGQVPLPGTTSETIPHLPINPDQDGWHVPHNIADLVSRPEAPIPRVEPEPDPSQPLSIPRDETSSLPQSRSSFDIARGRSRIPMGLSMRKPKDN